MTKKIFKRTRGILVFSIWVSLPLIIGFYNTPLTQAQTLEEFSNQRFVDVQAIFENCLAEADEPRDGREGELYQVLSHFWAGGNCSHQTWDNTLQGMCLKILPFNLNVFKAKEDLLVYQEAVAAAGLDDRFILIAKAHFFKDSSYCDGVPEKEDERDQSFCRAISSSTGINECLKNSDPSNPARKDCVDRYTFVNAVRTKNITACENIGSDYLKFACEVFLSNSEVVRDEMKQYYNEVTCYKEFAITLAVAGTLDPDGPENAESYCDKIWRKEHDNLVRYNQCKELVREAKVSRTLSSGKANQTPLSPLPY